MFNYNKSEIITLFNMDKNTPFRGYFFLLLHQNSVIFELPRDFIIYIFLL